MPVLSFLCFNAVTTTFCKLQDFNISPGHGGIDCFLGEWTLTYYDSNIIEIAVDPLPGNSESHKIMFRPITHDQQDTVDLFIRQHVGLDESIDDIHKVGSPCCF